MPSQPKKVGGSKPNLFKPSAIQKAPAPPQVDSSHQSPDVSRQEQSQSTLPKGIPTSVKKPTFALKQTKPSMMAGKPNLAGVPQKIKLRKEEDFDEEVASLMPDSMKKRDPDSSINMEPARVEQKKVIQPAPALMGAKVANK